jgi:hypothetical protein
MRTVPHLVLVLRADAPPEVRARTAERLAEVARTLGSAYVNRAISASSPFPERGAVIVRCDADRCVRLDLAESLVERIYVQDRPSPDRRSGAA